MVSWLKEESMEDVVWIKPDTKGYKIAGSGRQHSLILMDVGTEYSGTYTCIATNRAGQSICTARLEVDEGETQQGSALIQQSTLSVCWGHLCYSILVTASWLQSHVNDMMELEENICN